MGYQRDQRLPSERAEQDGHEEPPPPAYKPALPPRESFQELHFNANQGSTNDSGYLTPDAPRLERSQFTWLSQDPRSASTDSLLPDVNPHGKRKLLLIYIHGFMGNETSFQSFPAHLHGLVTELMVETHIVHTKIYPRYKSRRAIEFARDEFSNWLQPHHSQTTDVILLGHSMGGILSAEVVLQPSTPPSESPFYNRILGTINFDVPFLGMHPGVVASGLGSLFRGGGEKDANSQRTAPRGNEVMMPMPSGEFDLGHSPNDSSMLSQSSTRTMSESLTDFDRASRSMSPLSIPVDDPNYNPKFENDVIRPVRKGWESALHFMNKHSGNLRQAAKAYVTSHVEFGGTMADYPKLHARYKKIRALEDIKDTNQSQRQNSGPPRVRFINFYTASTGITKPKSRSASASSRGRQLNPKDIPGSSHPHSPASTINSTRSASPRISLQTPDGIQTSIETDQMDSANERDMQILDTAPLSDQDDGETDTNIQPLPASTSDSTKLEKQDQEDGLPPIPDLPIQPADFDPTSYQDKDVLKVAQKEHARKMKAYQSAVKDRDKTIADRKKLVEKREKKAAKEQEKALKDKERAAAKEAKLKSKQIKENEEGTTNPHVDGDITQAQHPSRTLDGASDAPSPNTNAGASGNAEQAKKKRDRKFCILPPKTNGVRDPAWRRVFMEGVDEVGAHCGLFFADKPHYEGLVGDVGEVVREWVRRATSARGE